MVLWPNWTTNLTTSAPLSQGCWNCANVARAPEDEGIYPWVTATEEGAPFSLLLLSLCCGLTASKLWREAYASLSLGSSVCEGADLTLPPSDTSAVGRGWGRKWQSACTTAGRHVGTCSPARLSHPSWIIKNQCAYCTLALTSERAVGLMDFVEKC